MLRRKLPVDALATALSLAILAWPLSACPVVAAKKPAKTDAPPAAASPQATPAKPPAYQFRPLVDHNAPAPAVTPADPAVAATTPSASTVDEASEALLKPAMPFIEAVETSLQLTPLAESTTRKARLDRLQTVTFGAVTYPDAGQALGKLAEVFPAEAGKAQAELLAELQRQQLQPAAAAPPASSQAQAKSKSKGGKRQALQAANAAPAVATPQQLVPLYLPPADAGIQAVPPAAYPPQAAAPTTPLRVGQSVTPQQLQQWMAERNDQDPFDDPFFSNSNRLNSTQGNGTSYQAPRQSGQAGETLRALGSGLASLAMIAAPLAGAYFLNKSAGGGGGRRLPANRPRYDAYGNPYYGGNYYGGGAYGLPYGYSPYGTALGTGASGLLNQLPGVLGQGGVYGYGANMYGLPYAGGYNGLGRNYGFYGY